MKKKLAMLLTAAMLVGSLAACGSSDNGSSATGSASATDSTKTDAAATEVSTEGKQLTVQIGPDPETIDPALNSAVDGGNMLLHSFECLLTIDQDGKIAPGQAETWEVSEDGLTWTFHLRDGLKWSDGSDLTADDFVYSWKRVCDPVVAAPYAETVLGMVKGFDEAQAGDLDAVSAGRFPLDGSPYLSGTGDDFLRKRDLPQLAREVGARRAVDAVLAIDADGADGVGAQEMAL